MERYNYSVSVDQEGMRLDVFLVDALKHKYSRSFLKRLIDDGKVTVNGGYSSARFNVNAGNEVVVDIPDPENVKIEPENIPLDIVHQDEDIIVINKPAGLVVHPAPGNRNGTLVNALLYYCKDLSGIGGVIRPGIVHRLDKDTSGLLIAAKNDKAHELLSKQFRSKTAGRVYIAFVRGIVQLDNGIIDLPIGRHPMDRKRMGVTFSNSKDAVTKYKVIKRCRDFTILEAYLETGRTHQIRVHMANHGYPLIGDKMYGSGKGMQRQALHSKRLSFFHPGTGKKMVFECGLPEDMKMFLKKHEND